MAAAAAVHAYRPRSPAEVEAAKRRRVQQAPGFDLPLLLRDINGQLNKNINSRQAADNLLLIRPEILTPLCLLDKQELVTLVREQLKIDGYSSSRSIGIGNVILILYSTSLINSRYGQIARDLERNIAQYIVDSSRSKLRKLIREARQLVEMRTDPTTMGRLGATIGKINAFSNLFFFDQPEEKRKMWNLLRHSNIFPVCLENFSILTRQLASSHQELELLSGFRTELQAKLTAIHREMASHGGERTKKLSPQKESFLDHRAQLLWDSGTELLEISFRTLLVRGKAHLPQDFVRAVDQAVRDFPEFKDLTIDALLAKPLDRLPPRFVSEVWDHFLGDIRGIVDIGDLMRHLIGKLPDEDFSRLDGELKRGGPNPKEDLLRALNQYLATQMRVPITPIALKEWLHSCR